LSADVGDTRAYLLAAGHGRRSGGPKAWREVDGQALLVRHVAFAREHFGEANLTVAIQSEWHRRCEDLSSLVRWVSVDPDAPPLASLLALTRAVPLDRWGFVYHVDMPLWDISIFERLAARARAEPRVDAVVPTYEGKGGHPV
jgi:CTP:molybdopterin cytidylyltransferase MocA